MKHNIIPLFPSVVFQSKLENNYETLFENLKLTTEFEEHVTSKNCYSSKKFNVLNDHIELKSDILNVFNFFKNEILNYHSTSFEITTSWITKVGSNSISHFHNHKNCLYSGVLYFDDLENCAPIEFSDDNLKPQSFMVNKPSNFNNYNCSTWSIYPAKNNILFFPSYLNHRVGLHKSNTPRYSLAFNLIPNGIFGYCDSSLNIHIN
jgi:uncharacterized protein (TIGR02466 family)